MSFINNATIIPLVKLEKDFIFLFIIPCENFTYNLLKKIVFGFVNVAQEKIRIASM